MTVALNASALQALEYVHCGVQVSRATTAMSTGLALFNVTGGRVLIPLILGEVTTIMEAAASACKLQADPATGTTNDLCATVEMNAAEQGTMITISGLVAGPMVLGKSGGVSAQGCPVIVNTGHIEIAMVAPLTGSIKWDLWYLPLDTGATVTAA